MKLMGPDPELKSINFINRTPVKGKSGIVLGNVLSVIL